MTVPNAAAWGSKRQEPTQKIFSRLQRALLERHSLWAAQVASHGCCNIIWAPVVIPWVESDCTSAMLVIRVVVIVVVMVLVLVAGRLDHVRSNRNGQQAGTSQGHCQGHRGGPHPSQKELAGAEAGA